MSNYEVPECTCPEDWPHGGHYPYCHISQHIHNLAEQNEAMREALRLAKDALGKIYDESDNYADGAEDAPLYARICNGLAHIAKPALAAINKALKEEQP